MHRERFEAMLTEPDAMGEVSMAEELKVDVADARGTQELVTAHAWPTN